MIRFKSDADLVARDEESGRGSDSLSSGRDSRVAVMACNPSRIAFIPCGVECMRAAIEKRCPPGGIHVMRHGFHAITHRMNAIRGHVKTMPLQPLPARPPIPQRRALIDASGRDMRQCRERNDAMTRLRFA